MDGVYSIFVFPSFPSLVIMWLGLQSGIQQSCVNSNHVVSLMLPEAFTQESISPGRLAGKSTLVQVDRMDRLTGSLFRLSSENWGEIEKCSAAEWTEATLWLFLTNSPPPKNNTAVPSKHTEYYVSVQIRLCSKEITYHFLRWSGLMVAETWGKSSTM